MATAKTWKTAIEFGGRLDNSLNSSANRVNRLLDGTQKHAHQTQVAINKIVANVNGTGSAKLAVNVRELNAKLAELDRQLADSMPILFCEDFFLLS